MKLKSLLFAAVAFGLMTAPAAAMTLINDDRQPYIVTVKIGEGDQTVEEFELEYDYAADEFCEEGCTIRLSNGTEMSFAGHELVTIRDGQFVIAN